MKPVFTPIDIPEWPRREVFHYFANMAPTGYSLTAELDVTAMRSALKKRGLKFFPAYLWLVTSELNKQIEFKCAYSEDVLGYWNTLNPLYAAFHDDTKTFSFMWTEYDDDFGVFYERYINDKAQYGDNRGALSKPGMPPPNCYTVSAVPWISFTHFAVHGYDNKNYFLPSVEAGKFYEKDGRLTMPLSLTCHHAATDGWHIKEFLHGLQEIMDTPYSWIK